MQQLKHSKSLKYAITWFAALPALLVVAVPAVNHLGRQVASAPQFKNWGLENKITDSHIHIMDAWKIETGSRSVVVGVVDTGIDPNHPDLKNNLWREPRTGNYGWDFVENKPNPIDEHGHGTHVSGILGASLNPKAGIAGVAQHVSIMAVRYYSDRNSGAENLRNSIKALNWAIDHGAKIINYSGGGPEFSKEEFETLKRARDKGVLLVAAAGNERQNADLQENYYYPCAYRLENIVCVAAINIRNEMLSSSNWGKQLVDVAAPGENILSTVPGARHAYMSGTSQATAFVTGLAALMLSKDPTLKPSDIKEIIRASVDRTEVLRERTLAGGKVNAAKTMMAVRDRIEPSRTLLAKSSPVGFRKNAKTNDPIKKIASTRKAGWSADSRSQMKSALKEKNLSY